jgi:hypothetical protein
MNIRLSDCQLLKNGSIQLYSIYCEGESRIVSHRRIPFVTIRKLLCSIFDIRPVFVLRWEIQTYVHRSFFRVVANRRHDVGKSNIHTQVFCYVLLPTEGVTWEKLYIHRAFLP